MERDMTVELDVLVGCWEICNITRIMTTNPISRNTSTTELIIDNQ